MPTLRKIGPGLHGVKGEWGGRGGKGEDRAVLVSALGDTPGAILREAEVIPVEMSGFIEVELSRIYAGKSLTSLKGRRGGLSRACCGKGQGEGCL